MLNRPAPTPAPTPSDSGLASGNPEFGGATFTASMESNLSAKADVMGAHHYFQMQTASGAESVMLGKMEITGLAPAGDSSITAALIAKVNEAISPVIGMIMKLPGALGFMHSFFEALGSFLLGNMNLMEMFNPMILGQHAAASFVKVGESIGTSLGSSLSLLPGHAPIFESMNHLGQSSFNLGHSAGDILSMKLNTSISGAPLSHFRIHDNFTQNLHGTASMHKPIFEGNNGILSGPSLSGHSMAEQMAGHSRLFTDGLAQTSVKGMGQSANSINTFISNNTNSAASNSSLVAETPKFDSGQQMTFQDAGYKMSSQTADTAANASADFGPSGKVPEAMGGANPNLIASNFNNAPGLNLQSAGAANAANAVPNTALTGLKAKQLSFESLQQNAGQSLAKPESVSHAAKPNVNSHSHAAPKIHHKQIAHAKPETVQAAKAPEAMPEVSPQAPGEAQAYTVQRGDTLWDLAKERLGDGTRWHEIYDMNKDLIGSNPDLIHTGAQLNLPGAAGSDLAHSSATSYTVQPGDNLWNLSKKFLGDGKQWGDLYSMNKDIIGANPRMIQPGQQLQIGNGSETVAGNSGMAPQTMDQSSLSSASGNSMDVGQAASQTQISAPEAPVQNAPAPQSEAMTPQIESMSPGATNNTLSSAPASVDPAAAATGYSNNAGAAQAATVSPVSMSLGKDLKSLFKS